MADERALAFLRELESADAAAAGVLAELDALAEESNAVGARAAELESLAARLPGELARLEDERAAADAEVSERRAAHARAESALAEAEGGRDGGRLAAARRDELRARDLARMAERRLHALRAEESQLEAEGEASAREADELGVAAEQLAGRIRERPGLAEQAGTPPGAGLAGLARWATDARAALFVARGRLASEREAVIRQANELGAAVLGEQLTAQSAASVARRVEQAQGDY